MDNTELAIYNLEEKRSKNLLVQRSSQFFPDWSPDGREILYVTTLCSAGCGHIIQENWVTKRRGGDARQLFITNSFSMYPVWSPAQWKENRIRLR